MNDVAMRRKLGWAWAVIVSALAATSCGMAPTPPVEGRPTVPGALLQSPLLAPAAQPAGQPTAASIQPQATRVVSVAGKGNVSGRAVLPAGREKHPSFIVPGELYLGTLVPAADPKLPPAIAVDPLTAPHAVVNQSTGDFSFTNVAPGTYALVMIGFSTSYVIEKPDGAGRVDVRVEPDRLTALGDVTLR